MLALLPGPALSAVAPPTVTLTMTFSRREQGGPAGGEEARREERRGKRGEKANSKIKATEATD